MRDPIGGRRNAEGGSQKARSTRFATKATFLSPHVSRLTPGGSRGFTLLEVMVAVAILAMVLVTLLGVNNRSVQDVILADHITTATLLAKREMTEMLRNPASRPKEAESEDKFPEEEFEDYTWKKTITPLMIQTGSETGPITITEIKVAVLWKEGGREESVELVSYE